MSIYYPHERSNKSINPNNKEVSNGKESVQRNRQTVRSTGGLVCTSGHRHHSRLSLLHVESRMRMVGLHRNDVGVPVLYRLNGYGYRQHNLQGEEVDRMVEGTRQPDRCEVRIIGTADSHESAVAFYFLLHISFSRRHPSLSYQT